MKPIGLDPLRDRVLRALQRHGVPAGHAHMQADLLIEAELRGRPSHGLLRLNRVVERIRNGMADPLARGEHRWRGNFLEVDGQRGLGPVVALAALEQLAARARSGGIAIAAIRNNNHLGMLAWYAERIARQGLVLIALCNSEALVHPWGGRKAMLGTNPIAIGVPGPDEPFVMDMATSLVSMGQIHDHANRGCPIPANWALDADGEPTTDAMAAKSGSIAPFGEAKGYALGLAFEVLIGTLTASAVGPDVHGTLDSDRPCNKGDVFIVIDPGSRQGTAAAIAAYLDRVRASGHPGPVGVPGDRARACRRQRIEGGIPMDESLWEQLGQLAGDTAGLEKTA